MLKVPGLSPVHSNVIREDLSLIQSALIKPAVDSFSKTGKLPGESQIVSAMVCLVGFDPTYDKDKAGNLGMFGKWITQTAMRDPDMIKIVGNACFIVESYIQEIYNKMFWAYYREAKGLDNSDEKLVMDGNVDMIMLKEEFKALQEYIDRENGGHMVESMFLNKFLYPMIENHFANDDFFRRWLERFAYMKCNKIPYATGRTPQNQAGLEWALKYIAENLNTIKRFSGPFDINRFKTVESVYKFVETFMTETKLVRARENSDVIAEDDEWLVIHPKTWDASCVLGKGTSWCTAKEDSSNYYNSYSGGGILFMIFKKGEEKNQLWPMAQGYLSFNGHFAGNVADRGSVILDKGDHTFDARGLYKALSEPVRKATENYILSREGEFQDTDHPTDFIDQWANGSLNDYYGSEEDEENYEDEEDGNDVTLAGVDMRSPNTDMFTQGTGSLTVKLQLDFDGINYMVDGEFDLDMFQLFQPNYFTVDRALALGINPAVPTLVINPEGYNERNSLFDAIISNIEEITSEELQDSYVTRFTAGAFYSLVRRGVQSFLQKISDELASGAINLITAEDYVVVSWLSELGTLRPSWVDNEAGARDANQSTNEHMVRNWLATIAGRAIKYTSNDKIRESLKAFHALGFSPADRNAMLDLASKVQETSYTKEYAITMRRALQETLPKLRQQMASFWAIHGTEALEETDSLREKIKSVIDKSYGGKTPEDTFLFTLSPAGQKGEASNAQTELVKSFIAQRPGDLAGPIALDLILANFIRRYSKLTTDDRGLGVDGEKPFRPVYDQMYAMANSREDWVASLRGALGSATVWGAVTRSSEWGKLSDLASKRDSLALTFMSLPTPTHRSYSNENHSGFKKWEGMSETTPFVDLDPFDELYLQILTLQDPITKAKNDNGYDVDEDYVEDAIDELDDDIKFIKYEGVEWVVYPANPPQDSTDVVAQVGANLSKLGIKLDGYTPPSPTKKDPKQLELELSSLRKALKTRGARL